MGHYKHGLLNKTKRMDIKEKVESLDAVENTTVTVTFDPAWKPEMMTDDAKEKLGFYPTPSENIENSEWE